MSTGAVSGRVSDWDQRSWDYDIASFERWRQFLDHAKSPGVRAHVIRDLSRIQSKWPRHIKLSEIPNE